MPKDTPALQSSCACKERSNSKDCNALTLNPCVHMHDIDNSQVQGHWTHHAYGAMLIVWKELQLYQVLSNVSYS